MKFEYGNCAMSVAVSTSVSHPWPGQNNRLGPSQYAVFKMSMPAFIAK